MQTHLIGIDAQLDVLTELSFESFRILLLQRAHVICHVLAEDVSAMDIRVERFRFGVVSWETLRRVRNVETSVNGTLHGGEYARTSRGTLQSHVQVAPATKKNLHVCPTTNRRTIESQGGSETRYNQDFDRVQTNFGTMAT